LIVIVQAVLAVVEGASQPLNGQSLEYLIRPYVGYLTFGIDVAAGIIIAISAATALFAFFKILRKSPTEQTQDKETIRLLCYSLLPCMISRICLSSLTSTTVPSGSLITTFRSLSF
jgi:hypothetical protein